MIDFPFILMSPFRRRFPVGTLLSLLVAFGLAGALLLLLRAPVGAQSTNEPFTVTASSGVDTYPTVTVTLSNVRSLAVSDALHTGQFSFCEDDLYCQNGAVVTPVGDIAPYHLLVVLDTSLLFPDLSTWSAITRSVDSLIKAMGTQDKISILPFSNWVGTPTAWTSDQAQALRDLNAITPDSTMTALNAALAEALTMIAKADTPTGRRRIVVIADRFDNTVNQHERESQLKEILQQAITANVPIDLYCYGPFVSTPFAEKVGALLEEGDGRLYMPPTAADLTAELQPVREHLNDFPRQFVFEYITKRPADDGMHKLNIVTNEPRLSGVGQFKLDRRDINDISLSFAKEPLTETKALTWATSMGQISTTVDGWPLPVTTVAYEVYIDKQPNSYGPFTTKEATIDLHFTAITNVTVLSPYKVRETTIRAIVTDVNGNKGYRVSTLLIAPPPAFDLAITPTEILADQVAVVEPVYYTIIARNDITGKDKFLIKLNNQQTNPISLADTKRLLYAPPPFGLNFLRELSGTVWTTVAQLPTKPPAETQTIQACLKRFPTICRGREYTIQPLSARESWRRFLWAWRLPLLLWPLALLSLLLLIGLVRAIYRLRVIEIPVKVENRGDLFRRCYLQAQEAPLPPNPDSLWYKLRQWITQRLFAKEVLPPDWQNNPVLTARHLHNVRFSYFDPDGNPLTTTTSPVQNSPERTMRALSVLPLEKVQQLARRYHLSQPEAAAFGRFSTIVPRIPKGLHTLWQAMIGWFDRTTQQSIHQPMSQANYTPTYVQSDWFPTQAIEPKPSGKPPQSVEVILRVESLTWWPRKRVRIVVRASPDGVTNVCEYELELGLGAFWWRRPFALTRLKCL